MACRCVLLAVARAIAAERGAGNGYTWVLAMANAWRQDSLAS
jgi:hypothetical protein